MSEESTLAAGPVPVEAMLMLTKFTPSALSRLEPRPPKAEPGSDIAQQLVQRHGADIGHG
jgi:hypothetical protein